MWPSGARRLLLVGHGVSDVVQADTCARSQREIARDERIRRQESIRRAQTNRERERQRSRRHDRAAQAAARSAQLLVHVGSVERGTHHRHLFEFAANSNAITR